MKLRDGCLPHVVFEPLVCEDSFLFIMSEEKGRINGLIESLNNMEVQEAHFSYDGDEQYSLELMLYFNEDYPDNFVCEYLAYFNKIVKPVVMHRDKTIEAFIKKFKISEECIGVMPDITIRLELGLKNFGVMYG